MPKTYEQNLHDIEASKAIADREYEKEKDKLYNESLFSKAHIDWWELRYNEMLAQRPYLILFGVSIGAILTIVIIHYT